MKSATQKHSTTYTVTLDNRFAAQPAFISAGDDFGAEDGIPVRPLPISDAGNPLRPNRPMRGDVVTINGKKAIIDQVGSKFVTLLDFTSRASLGMFKPSQLQPTAVRIKLPETSPNE